MKVVFYSSSTNLYDASSFHYSAYPACWSQLEELSAAHPEHEFAVVARLPAFFLLDIEDDGSFRQKAPHVTYDVTSTASPHGASGSGSVGSGTFAFNTAATDAAGCGYQALSADKASGTSVPGETDEKRALSTEKTPPAFMACADAIAALSPGIAIAATCWMTPLDWLPLEDALIADELKKRGIRVLCHSTETAALCFDKQEMHRFLMQHGFHAARALHLKLALFWAERGNRGAIKSNPYKEMLLKQLETLTFPVVIKDTTGLSSFGMDVAPTAKAARAILLSRKTNGDRLIEEYISGDQFGVEVYGTPGNYTVMTPFLFSVTKHGITSPKQSVKLSVSGDEAERRFKLDEMRKTVVALSEALKLEGAAQFDLVFSGAAGLESGQVPSEQNGGWYIIEVNTRLSGLSVPTAVLAGKSVHRLLLETALATYAQPSGTTGLESVQKPACGLASEKCAVSLERGKMSSCGAVMEKHAPGLESREMPACDGEPVCGLTPANADCAPSFENGQKPVWAVAPANADCAPACVLDVKLTVLAEERFEELCALSYVHAVNQTANDAARQNREKGYCEVVIGAETPAVLLARLDELKTLFPDELDDAFVESARELVGRLC